MRVEIVDLNKVAVSLDHLHSEFPIFKQLIICIFD